MTAGHFTLSYSSFVPQMESNRVKLRSSHGPGTLVKIDFVFLIYYYANYAQKLVSTRGLLDTGNIRECPQIELKILLVYFVRT